MARANAQAVREASTKAGLKLSDAEINSLVEGKDVEIRNTHVAAAPARGCSGIKIVDLGGGCGLYFNPFPPGVSVCCEG